MRIAIISFLNANHESEISSAIERAGAISVKNNYKEKLLECDGYIIVDMKEINGQNSLIHFLTEQNELSKPILGIGEGAHILLEMGLVPGLENNKVGVTFLDNPPFSSHVTETHIRLSDNYQYNAFSRLLTSETILKISMTGDRRYFIISPALLLEVQENGLNVFQYCDQQGRIVSSNAVDNIAAVSNKTGNVMAMAPYFEWTGNGDLILQSMCDYIANGYKQKVRPLSYYPRS